MSDSPLGESFAALSRFFVGDLTVQDTLERVAGLAADAIAGAHLVGMTILVEGRQRTAVFTDPTAVEIDQTQYDTGDGPCLDAFQTGHVVAIDSTFAPGPYPAFRKAAAAHGVNSTLSVPLTVAEARLGALNLYSFVKDGFDRDDRDTAVEFAGHAAIVLANAQAYWDAHGLSLRLQEAMEFRAVIEQAKGILMASQACSADDAFDTLVAASQRENVKLRAIAQRIVQRASSPPDAGSPEMV